MSYHCRSTFASLAFPSLRSSLGSLRSCLALTSHTASVPSDRAEPGPEGDIRRREAGCEVGHSPHGKGQWAARAEPKFKWREAAPFAHFTGPSAPSSLRAGNRAKRETRHSFIRSLRRRPRGWRDLSLRVSLSWPHPSLLRPFGRVPPLRRVAPSGATRLIRFLFRLV